MIALLSYSSSWCQNNHIPSTGDLEQTDSLVLIPISALKIANAKMVELKYEKEINVELKEIIHNDSIIISSLKSLVVSKENDIKTYKKQRNIATGTGLGLTILLIIALL